MKTWTVLGVYDDGASYADVFKAETHLQAIILCAQNADADDLMIIGAVEGDHTLHTPCDETGHAAYVRDLCELAEAAE